MSCLINFKILVDELQKWFVNDTIHKDDLAEVLVNLPTVDAVPVRDIEKAIDNIGVIARASNNTNFINGCTASLNELYKALTPQKMDGKKV